MAEGRTLISITPANIVSIWILGLVGFALLVGANMAYMRLTGGGAAPASS
jgi:hypothetical protein